MAVPKHRTSKQKKRSRRSHQALKMPSLTTCSKCGTKNLTHIVCRKCGFYKNEVVLSKKEKK
ncbi:MAG: 50S ribosomal protein L32 [Mollicutes bacterium]|nr:MAG: 50S ribosomal protein L32 [Mollicutes bacterium]